MAGLGNRAVALALSRLASFGLLLIGPIVLVRLLSVHDFGRYREFLLYASVLQVFATFFHRDSLLYFIPAHPQSQWRVVRIGAALTGLSSVLTVLLLYAGDRLTGGALVGEYLMLLIAYTLFSVNLDFWEYLWIARNRPMAVFVYSVSRLSARLIVVIVAAALTHDVVTIMWSLVAFEAVRFLGAGLMMLTLDKAKHEPPIAEGWREQLRFCIPAGSASLLSMANRNLSNLVVAKVLGTASLAQYTIGKFNEYVVLAMRNSLTAVVLPDMVRRDRHATGDALVLWKQAIVVNTIFLFPVAVLVARYAEPIVALLFGEDYLAAALIMQIHMLVVIRECFDFAPALRAVNRTGPFVASHVVALITGAVALVVLLPLAGLPGAMIAFAIACYADAAYLCRSVCRQYAVSLRDVLPWHAVAKTALAAAVAGLVVASSFWTDTLGLAGIPLAGLVYVAVFVITLLKLRVAEADLVLNWVLRTVRIKRASGIRGCAG